MDYFSLGWSSSLFGDIFLWSHNRHIVNHRTQTFERNNIFLSALVFSSGCYPTSVPFCWWHQHPRLQWHSPCHPKRAPKKKLTMTRDIFHVGFFLKNKNAHTPQLISGFRIFIALRLSFRIFFVDSDISFHTSLHCLRAAPKSRSGHWRT